MTSKTWLLAIGSFLLSSHALATVPVIYLSGSPVEAQAPAPAIIEDALFTGPAPDLRALARNFLAANARALGLGTNTRLTEREVARGSVLETHRYRKTWNGLDVEGGDTLVHVRGGRIAFASSDATPLLGLEPRAQVSPDSARTLAFASYAGRAHAAGAPKLEVLVHAGEAHLAYLVTVLDADLLASDVHFIDAQSGAELLVTSNVQPLADRRVLSALGDSSDFGVATDADETRIDRVYPQVFADKSCPAPNPCAAPAQSVLASALAAWTNSGLVYDYYQSAHARDSVDGKGFTLRSVVNFGGTSFQNAAWYNDRKVMLYGMGQPGSDFNDFASALDVVAHELTHGVTASTAALQYASESGALNESYSDVFGKLVAFHFSKTEDWFIGRDLFRGGNRFVRNLENPPVGNVKDFEYRGEPCSRANDFCGVHDNSGIPSRAAVMIAKALGLDKFAKLYYLTLTQLLRSASDFKDARAQTIAGCGQLYGAESANCKAVADAFTAVGVEGN